MSICISTRCSKRWAYTLLEASQVRWAQRVRLGNHGDQVHTGAQSLHDFDIERLQGMASRSDEVQTCVDTEVNLVGTTGLLLLQHVGLMLVVEELDDGHPGVTVVDVVAEAGGVDDG